MQLLLRIFAQRWHRSVLDSNAFSMTRQPSPFLMERNIRHPPVLIWPRQFFFARSSIRPRSDVLITPVCRKRPRILCSASLIRFHSTARSSSRLERSASAYFLPFIFWPILGFGSAQYEGGAPSISTA